MTLRVALTPSARRNLRKLDQQVARRVLDALSRYAETETGDVRKLADVYPPEWRLRVGDYRVRFRRRHDTLEVLYVGPRSEAYRR